MPIIEEIEETRIENFENENLTYEVFIDKGIKLIEKIYILIHQYNRIKDNTETLIDEIGKKIKIINMKKENHKKLDIDLKIDLENYESKDIAYLVKNIKNKLFNLNILLNNYVENFKNYISYKSLQIKELCQEFCDKKNYADYDRVIKEIDKLIFRYGEFNTNDITNNLFDHIINISNIYILITKNILCINIIINIGEILKKQNTILKIIYKDLN